MSKLRPCPDCGHMVSPGAFTCPGCGRVVMSFGCLGNFFAFVGLLEVIFVVWVCFSLLRACSSVH